METGSRLVHKCVHTADETGQNCSASNILRTAENYLRLSPTQFTPQTRQDKTVLSCRCRRCELAIRSLTHAPAIGCHMPKFDARFRHQAVNGVRSCASTRKTGTGIWRRIYGADIWSVCQGPNAIVVCRELLLQILPTWPHLLQIVLGCASPVRSWSNCSSPVRSAVRHSKLF